MQIDSDTQIPPLIKQEGFSIFVFPPEMDYMQINLPHALLVEPIIGAENKTSKIKVDQIRELLTHNQNKQIRDLTILIRPGEQLSEEASNALLKVLEAPQQKLHFAIFCHQLSLILPTIRSRAAIYRLKNQLAIDAAPQAKKSELELAKQILTASPKETISIAEKISKGGDARTHSLRILQLCIELAYKSYFKTGNQLLLQKITKLLATHQAIEANGNIKLQFVANLI